MLLTFFLNLVFQSQNSLCQTDPFQTVIKDVPAQIGRKNPNRPEEYEITDFISGVS